MHPRLFCKRLRPSRKPHTGTGTPLIPVLDREVTAHGLNEHVRRVQAEARALARGFCRRERLEEPGRQTWCSCDDQLQIAYATGNRTGGGGQVGSGR